MSAEQGEEIELIAGVVEHQAVGNLLLNTAIPERAFKEKCYRNSAV